MLKTEARMDSCTFRQNFYYFVSCILVLSLLNSIYGATNSEVNPSRPNGDVPSTPPFPTGGTTPVPADDSEIPELLCDAHEYLCKNKNCVNKIYVCDGENDCYDNSDEDQCGPPPPGSRCPASHFDCGDNTLISDFECIFTSFRCDGQTDCVNGADEVNCTRPRITESTTSPIDISIGETVHCICAAVGVPPPIISWRFNERRLPFTPKLTVQSLNGKSQLTIRNATKALSGSYGCEAHNNRGSVRAYPKCVINVLVPGDACKPPRFNAAALSPDECRECFCMGVTQDCQSASLYKQQIVSQFVDSEHFHGFRLVNEKEEELDTTKYRIEINSGVLTITNITEATNYYWKLPNQYLGKRLTSYGGVLQFHLKHSSSSTLGKIAVIQNDQQPDNLNQSKGRTPADVIIKGQGLTLEYHHIIQPRPDVFNHLITPLVEEVWKTVDGKLARREDIMRVLFNLDSILVRIGSKKYQSISVKGVSLDVTASSDTGLGRAVFVEKCRCPDGYEGLSCQSCAAGYIRDPDAKSFPVRCIKCACHGHSNECDPNNGTCFNCAHNTVGPHCEKCRSGFYGNARNGTPNDCLPCPCPRDRPPNRFSKTCFLAKDGKPTCDACEMEYTGRNCERCSKNYTGNPLVPGEKCLPAGPESCDIRGSYSEKPERETRKCRCKPYVTGETCNACLPGYFGLGLDPHGGCLRCFCNGVSEKCTSSTLNKTQVVLEFTKGGSQGVTITNINQTSQDESFLYSSVTQELVYKINRDRVPVFWKLPERFTGNKLTSYGGILSFVSSFDTSKQGKTLTVYLKGGEMTLKNSQTVGLQQQEFTFVLKEGLWRNLDDEVASRDRLMMVLSSVSFILIEALYDSKTSYASLREVSLDMAVDRPTNQSRALRVEQCACPKGYLGMSCETCGKGHFKSKVGDFLGKCLKCACNMHSDECDVSDGTCQNCLHNTHGDHCEKCKPGFYGDPTIGSIYDCRSCACPMTKPPNRFSKTCFIDRDGFPTCDACPIGYTGRRCESCRKPFVGNPLVVGDFCKFEEDCGCDPRGTVNKTCDPFTRQCFCKANVEGKRCNKCRVSYFNLDSSNPDGCMPCFCFGVSSECKCARGFRDKVTLSHRYEPISQENAIRLGDRLGITVVNTGILLVGVPPHFVYNRFDRLPRKTYYWYLPKQFLGDKISAYGGTLSYTISHDMLPGGQLTRESDVEIRGYGLVLIHKMHFPPTGGEEITHNVRMVESSFTFPHGPAASREDLIIALSAIKSILIRAAYSSTTYQASLFAVTMDITVPHDTLLEQVNTVEQCACPAGYAGLSCQKCARGYTRVKPGPGFSRCVRCNCNKHSLECDPDNGKCLNCNDNTGGDNCELCKDGYYGDATQGTSADCKVCACPLSIRTNLFSPTCRIDIDGYPTCTACQPGYMGRDCGRCSQGYTGNPRSPGGKCEKVPEELLPKATVWPQYRRDSEGTRSVFYCLSNGKRPLTVTWSRLDNYPLSSRAQTDSRAVSIPNVRKQDEGGYVCTVRNAYGQHTARGTLNVLARPEDPITVSVSPRTLHISARKTARFVCKAKSLTYATLKWTKGQSGTLPPGSIDKDGVLTIQYATRRHTGTYTCTGSNQYSFDQISVQLRVAAVIKPQVSIIPRFLTVDEGDPVEFLCSASGFPPPELAWISGTSNGLIPDEVVLSKGNSVFQIRQAKKSHEGEYFCVAKNDGAVGRMRTVLNVRAVGSAPVVQINNKQLSVTEGDVAEFKCTATGDPQPIIRWTRVEGNFSQSSSRISGLLRIDPTSLEDEGTYVCTAANRFGAVADNAVLSVEKDLSIAPTASVFPDEITVNEGETAEITCEIDGSPKPSMEWNRVGGVLRDNHIFKGNRLSIVNITDADEGMYVCIAQNRKGVKQATAIIRVTKNLMPKIEIMPAANQTVTGGDTVVFRCMVKQGEPKPSVMWMDHHERPMNTTSAHVRDNVLMISRASSEDEGRYVCRASNSMGTVYAEAVLAVQAEPRVSVTPASPHVVPVGSQVTLGCSATGDPFPKVQWIAPVSTNSILKPVEIKPGVLQLVIEHVTLEDQGDYRCMATNVVRSTETVIELVVTPLINKPPEVLVSPANFTVLEGEKVVFHCNKSGIPTPSASWSRLGGILPDTAITSESGLLRIESVSARDQGVYLCTATNSEGSASAKARLQVLVPPQVSITPQQVSVNLGDSVRLFCVSTPPLLLTWTKLKGSISNSAVIDGGVLIVDKTTVEDAGKYRCEASNAAGSTEAVAMVTVFVPPKVDVSPANHVASLGSNITFHCNTTGIPQPITTWTKENGNLPKNHITEGGSLSIFDMEAVDQGMYLCTATNAAGHSEMTVNLAIEGLPSVSIVGGTSVKTVPVGGNLTLQCIGTGIPRPVIRWNRVNGEMPDNVDEEDGVLVIKDAQPSYGGNYRCTVANRVGSVQSHVIFIQDAPKVTINPEVRRLKVGETAEFNCIASGSPSPEVSWGRLNDSLPRRHTIKGGQLIITDVSRDDAGIYICRATNVEGIAESSATIKIKGTVPRFEQNPLSFMTFPTLTNDNYNFTVELFFTPEIADGLILYNDQHDNGGIGDFVSFGMSDGFAEFRFDLGSGGPAVIRSKYQLVLNDWYTVKLTRYQNQGTLQVNDEGIRRGLSKGKTTQLNLNQRLHIGGVANFSLIDNLAGFSKGFIGCVGYVAVDKKPIELGDPVESVGLTDCEPCLAMPCKNTGKCLEINKAPGFVCQCRFGFKGPTCQGFGERCFPGACKNGRCVNLEDTGFKCVCPVGYTGQRCEEGTKIETPMFEGSSFMSYPAIQGALLETKLSMRFMLHEDGNMLLLYNGQQLYPNRGDFISLAVIDGKLEFRFDLGYGAAVIKSKKNITSGHWHTVVAERFYRDGSMILDSEPAVKEKAPCCSVGLNLALPLYIGGLPNLTTEDTKKLGVDKGLMGCVSDLSIDDNEVDLVNSYVEMRGIHQCKACLLPCQVRPCMNNATCEPQGQTGYICVCTPGYTGKNCEYPLVGPGKNRTCLNGGLPFPPTGRVCDCPIGYGGTRCESIVQLQDTASFSGDGYVQYPSTIMKRILRKPETITLRFKTSSRNGLIFWQGQKIGASKGDYIAVGLRNGYLEYSFDLGAGPAELVSRRRLDDGKWHYVKIFRQSQDGALLVDKDEMVNGTSSEGARSLNSPGPIFLGGGEDIASLTFGRFTDSYKGCTGGLYLQGRAVKLQKDAAKGYNVLPCDTDNDDEI